MIEKSTKSSDLQSQAREEHLNGNSSKAILLLTEAIQEDSSNLDVAMDMVQVFLDIDELEQAISLFSKLPDAIAETPMGNSLNTQINLKTLASKTEGKDSLRERILLSQRICKLNLIWQSVTFLSIILKVGWINYL